MGSARKIGSSRRGKSQMMVHKIGALWPQIIILYPTTPRAIRLNYRTLKLRDKKQSLKYDRFDRTRRTQRYRMQPEGEANTSRRRHPSLNGIRKMVGLAAHG